LSMYYGWMGDQGESVASRRSTCLIPFYQAVKSSSNVVMESCMLSD
jgi:hypothetical protein